MLTELGSLFHFLGAATGKELSPRDDGRVGGTRSVRLSTYRKWQEGGDVRSQMEALGEIMRRCTVEAAACQHTQPELVALWKS